MKKTNPDTVLNHKLIPLEHRELINISGNRTVEIIVQKSGLIKTKIIDFQSESRKNIS